MKTLDVNGVIIMYSKDTPENCSSEFAELFLKMTLRNSVIVVHNLTGGEGESRQMEALKSFCTTLNEEAVIYEYSVASLPDRDASGQVKLLASVIKMQKAGFEDISWFFADKYAREFIYYHNDCGISVYSELLAWSAGSGMWEFMKDNRCREILKHSIGDTQWTVKALRELLNEIDCESTENCNAGEQLSSQRDTASKIKVF